MIREGCSADAVLGGRTSNNTDAEELPYKCSSGSGRAMGNNTRCDSAKVVGREGQASAHVAVPYDHSDV